ncbi:MAG: site-specific DNA-methyltransferase [Bacteroidota bacterium]|nr:site-specific DNA-methyltransferase [Bacteroidota bacterium]
MPTLHWIGKDKVINHHMDVPFKVLEHSYGFDNGNQTDTETQSGNKIIHGDNLEALKALLPEYEGKIKCIYIDPPYNTGNESWVYNDNVNDPKIKKWLGQVVGKEGDDLSRHDKWLCMMYPRLKLLYKLLSEEGAIFISIDDNEQANLKLICDEIFGGANFLTSVVWQKSKKGDAKLISVTHEYIVVYTKNKNSCIQAGLWRKKKDGADVVLAKYKEFKKLHQNDHEVIAKEIVKWFNSLPKDAVERNHKHYKFSDDRGLYFAADFSGPNDGRESRPRYDIIHPITLRSCKKPSTGWRWEEAKALDAISQNPPRIHFGKDETTIPCRKSYLFEIDNEPLMSVFYRDGRAASKLVDELLGKKSFDFPKDSEILQEWIGAVTKDNDIILDSFAGSGTTAQAVLQLNKMEGTNRKFILIELEDYALTKTASRVNKIIQGYNRIGGTGGSFDYYELGQPMFLEDGNLNETVGVEKIRQYIWYSETKQSLNRDSSDLYDSSDLKNKNQANQKNQLNQWSHYLGKHNDTAYYFNYEPNQITTLDHAFLSIVKTKAEQYVIYADNCLLTKNFTTRHHIIFKKIPRDITRF